MYLYTYIITKFIAISNFNFVLIISFNTRYAEEPPLIACCHIGMDENKKKGIRNYTFGVISEGRQPDSMECQSSKRCGICPSAYQTLAYILFYFTYGFFEPRIWSQSDRYLSLAIEQLHSNIEFSVKRKLWMQVKKSNI